MKHTMNSSLLMGLPASDAIHPDKFSSYGFVWKHWVNIPNEIAIFHRDNDQQNQIGFRGLAYFQTNPYQKSYQIQKTRLPPLQKELHGKWFRR